jgi:L-threonylcarbamoyladenylate synthase
MDFKTDIEQSLIWLKNGGIILYPTDTIWGIGCDATNANAVNKIFAIKKRDESKSMILLLDDADKLLKYIKEVPPLAYDLIECATSPLTIIYPDAINLAKNVVADDGSIAIRIVEDDFCNQLIRKFNKPIVSTSANISGEIAPDSFAMISDEIKNGVEYIVSIRQRENKRAAPSSIIKLGVGGEVKVVRK